MALATNYLNTAILFYKQPPSLGVIKRKDEMHFGDHSYLDFNKSYNQELSRTLKGIDYEQVGLAMQLIKNYAGKERKIWVCGNGGSATIAAHFAHNLSWDTSSRLPQDKKISSVALNSLSTEMSARMNDVSGKLTFATMVRDHIYKKDLLIAISASGESENIVNALKQANQLGIKTLVITKPNTPIAKLADIAIVIPSKDQQIIEDATHIIMHQLVRMVEGSMHNKTPETISNSDLANLRNKHESIQELSRSIGIA